MRIGITIAYMTIVLFLIWQVETRGPVAHLLKELIELALGQELTWK